MIWVFIPVLNMIDITLSALPNVRQQSTLPRLSSNQFGEEIKDKSPLIREQFNIDNPFTAKAPKILVKANHVICFRRCLLKRSGINPLKPGQKRRDVMPSHGLRKFFITECDKANIKLHSKGIPFWSQITKPRYVH